MNRHPPPQRGGITSGGRFRCALPIIGLPGHSAQTGTVHSLPAASKHRLSHHGLSSYRSGFGDTINPATTCVTLHSCHLRKRKLRWRALRRYSHELSRLINHCPPTRSKYHIIFCFIQHTTMLSFTNYYPRLVLLLYINRLSYPWTDRSLSVWLTLP